MLLPVPLVTEPTFNHVAGDVRDGLHLILLADLRGELDFGGGVDLHHEARLIERVQRIATRLQFREVIHAVAVGVLDVRIRAGGVFQGVADAVVIGVTIAIVGGDGAEFLILPLVRQPVVVEVIREVGDGGLEHADGVGRVVDALAAFDVDKLPVPSGIQEPHRPVRLGRDANFTKPSAT